MSAREMTFGSPWGSRDTTRPTPQQMCEKLWTLPETTAVLISLNVVSALMS